MSINTKADTVNRRDLYPAIEPYNTGMLDVSDVHSLYFEECGNPQGKPVVYLHGGPGGGCSPMLRQFFDSDAYRIVLFDQRGCGRSTPHASLEDNTTWHSVADIESLREHLGIDTWQVFGGSWGSTLALAYAETHSARCSELVLRGLFTLRRSELLWFYQEGASHVFPDIWEGYLAPIPIEERGDMMAAYYKRLTGDDKEKQLECARAWSLWEGSTLSLWPDLDREAHFGDDEFAIAFARIECHYFVNGGFFEVDDQIIRDLDKVRHIPTVLVQGRYDMCTPARTAWDIHKAWPEAEFHLVHDAGHASSEPGIIHELIEATDKFRN
ncbi:MAG: prolyl aminopeptidase [Rhodospirillales bacterium]|jgi:proline iminopeptidase|nr:prolyl aminopeptidase [Rhodospirillales bacterium]MBT4039174.1 prolyl aminopeptidase [Rhodospirillales bacterium]MBT4625587.1 prolyl aminopeptidase [Rhodospirillales bacterium]MBT5351025.1 prolyl aminopeptidase [Rhodospirillales bacterium]MBT5521417.1 prolyl aminopeptidase [Rhodospirillales bacterium]